LGKIYGNCLKATYTENRSTKPKNLSYVVFYHHERDLESLPTLKVKSNLKISAIARSYNTNFHHVGINSAANLENHLDDNQEFVLFVF
jgi:hypothetical protein